MSRPRVVLVVTDSRSALLLRGQLSYLSGRGFDVHLVSGAGRIASDVASAEGATHHVLELERDIAPRSDAVATMKLYRLFRSIRPSIVDGSTPKAGLLAMVAAAAARVPVRVHTLRGLRHTTLPAMKSAITWSGHRLTCSLAHRVVCVSHSLRAQAIDLGVTSAESSVVLGEGSGNGVDLTAFTPTEDRRAAAAALRAAWGIDPEASVVGFVGRLAEDKGLAELAKAWHLVGPRGRAWLVIAGSPDPTDPVGAETMVELHARHDVLWLGEVRDMAPLYLACDVVVMPSRREGLNNVLLEAAAMGRPTVTTRIPGCSDAIVDGVTGNLVAPLDPVALAGAIGRYLDDPALAAAHGEAGRDRVVRCFEAGAVHRRIADEYDRLMGTPASGRSR